MDRYREKASTFFTGLANGLSREQRPATVPLPKSLGPPAHQTSASMSSCASSSGRTLTYPTLPILAVFELSDELILSIISHVSPEPQFTGHYGQLRLQYGMVIDDHHQRRVRFLLPLSMTCRAMRIRLRSWIWERLECPEGDTGSEQDIPRKLNTIMKALSADASLATSVRYLLESPSLLPGSELICIS